MRLAAIATLLMISMISALFAQEHPHPAPGAPHETAAQNLRRRRPRRRPPLVENDFQYTSTSIQINGKTLAYTATAGTLILKKDDKPWASMFYVAYTRDDVQDAAKRPITFAFNGGPGSASVWLHLGALGPKRVEMGAGRRAAEAAVSSDGQRGHRARIHRSGVHRSGDHRFQPRRAGRKRQRSSTASTAIWNRWPNSSGCISRASERWGSPKFLAGESYGTTRAAALSDRLLENDGIYLNGITLISTVLNFETISFARGNDLPYPLFLPSLHGRRLVSQEASEGFAGRLRKSRRRIAALCGQRIHRGADERRQVDGG